MRWCERRLAVSASESLCARAHSSPALNLFALSGISWSHSPASDEYDGCRASSVRLCVRVCAFVPCSECNGVSLLYWHVVVVRYSF
jgi:hypothetical protein